SRDETGLRDRLAEQDPGPAHVGLPARRVGLPSEVLVRILDPAVVLFLVGIRAGAAQRIPHRPEVLDELVTRLFLGHPQEGLALFVGDDVIGFFLEPLGLLFRQAILTFLFSGGRRQTNDRQRYDSVPQVPHNSMRANSVASCQSSVLSYQFSAWTEAVN